MLCAKLTSCESWEANLRRGERVTRKQSGLPSLTEGRLVGFELADQPASGG
jgi:hypothetical protein